jgi:transcription termination/antitermination protein NusA
MNGEELIRLVDAIHRDKDIDKEILFEALEMAMLTAVKKKYGEREELAVEIDRETGKVDVWDGEFEAEGINMAELGRIAAQTAKQVIIQKIRDAERDVIFGDYEDKVNTIVSGSVQRIEMGNIIVNIGRAEGIVPKHEKVRTENYNPGDRIKAIVYDVKKVGPKVKIMLSRAAPELVLKLFDLEVPEIADRVIQVRAIAREPGFRTKIAVHSIDSRVDCIGACVGIRGSRIKAITDELNGEKIDIIRWSDNLNEFITQALKPAVISAIEIDEPNQTAHVLVNDDQLSLAIGRKGQNVRLASRLTGYEIKIKSPTQAAYDEPAGSAADAEIAKAREALLTGGVSAPSAEAAAEAPAPVIGADEFERRLRAELSASRSESAAEPAAPTENTPPAPSTPPATDATATGGA